MTIRKTGLALAAMAVLASSAALAAEPSPWMVRVRALQMNTANQSSSVPALGINRADAIEVSDKTFPEFDVSYFFTPNWAAELVLTYPQKHDVTLNTGTDRVDAGSFKHLPPILSLQYHFTPDSVFKPYVGLGLNYTRISDVKLAGGATLEKDSFGPAFGAGFDYRLSEQTYLNVDVKKVLIRTDVFADGAKVADLKVDPLLVSVGLGWRF